MFVIRMQRENHIQCMHQHGIRLVFLGRRAKHHVHEVGRVIQIVPRIHEWLANAVFIRHGNNGRYLGDQPVERNAAMFGIGKIMRLMVKS